MRAGRLDRLITIQAATETKDSFGAVTQTWADEASVWANVKPLKGEEYTASDAVNARRITVFIIRHRTVTTLHRISYNGDIYDIVSVVEIGRREGLEILAEIHR